jgi:uncharacterized membrane protein YeaQ/YmgE (transglycosylase-associated protein family)
MRPSVQLIVTMAAIGLLIGRLAPLAFGGTGLIIYLIAGVVGSFIGGLWLLVAIGVQISDPFLQTLLGAPVGAIILVVLAGLILRRTSI